MKDISTVPFHRTAEKIVSILCKKTQNTNPHFFRILVSYYLAKMASTMRVKILTKDRGEIPVNLYALSLANSGQGKGHSTNIIDEYILNEFKSVFFEETMPQVAEMNLARLATKRAAINGNDPADQLLMVEKEFKDMGKFAFSFDSGTTAAVKQMRHMLLMMDIGAMSLEIDEIGSNLVGNIEVLNTYLELFDVGKVKQKLIKNTADQTRSEEIDGRTPTNLLLFGTPSKLLNGGKTEEEFYSMLETGYARRCIFGYSRENHKNTTLSPKEIYDMLTNPDTSQYLQDLSSRFGRLANVINYDKKVDVSEDVSILLIEYRLKCEALAEAMGEHEAIRSAEMAHRYFKALKLAGTYAFIDGDSEITEDNLYAAIKMIEESGKAFDAILNRDRNYVKLAKYVASIGKEVTHVDLVEDLPFYKGSMAVKQELMQLATAWGYKNHIVIKKSFTDGIEFLRGESLKNADITRIPIAYSTHEAFNYFDDYASFDKLDVVMQHKSTLHWVNHHMKNGHRCTENAIPGFSIVVLDVDSGISLSTAQLLLKQYKCAFYTTKRHTDNLNRFRIILPLNYELTLDETDYKGFMNNIYEWLPFEVDTQTGQRAKKWLTNPGCEYIKQDGELLDALLFIPKTTKSEERKKIIRDQQSLTNLERWFVNNIGDGNRNVQMIKYALMLVDSGQSIDVVRNNVLALNDKLPDKLTTAEISDTIMVTVTKAIMSKDA